MQRVKRVIFWAWISTSVVLLLLLAWSQFSSPGKEYAVATGDVAAHMGGRWAWRSSDDGCATDWHQITFSPDHRTMTIAKLAQGADTGWTATYDIQQLTRSRVRGAIRGETRKTDAGTPVVWDLVLFGPDEYRWHRTDWASTQFTGAVRKCGSPTGDPE